jgi:hypothetical protein
MTQKVVKRFIKKDLIYRYALPVKLITDNANNLNRKLIVELYTKWRIMHFNYSLYRPKMNGTVETTKKISRRSSRKW